MQDDMYSHIRVGWCHAMVEEVKWHAPIHRLSYPHISSFGENNQQHNSRSTLACSAAPRTSCWWRPCRRS